MRISVTNRRRLVLAFIVTVLLCIWYGRLVLALTSPAVSSRASGENGTFAREYPPDTFSYARLGITAPIINAPHTDPFVIADWEDIRKNLKAGVQLTYTSNQFSHDTMAYIIGHSSDTYPHRFSSVFAALGQARIGDTFWFTVGEQPHLFTVVDMQVIDPGDYQTFHDLTSSDDGIQRVALVTCWPLLTTKMRLIVVGERRLG